MREIVKDTDFLEDVLRDESKIPFNAHEEYVTAENLIEFAKENAWVLEMVIEIVKKYEKLQNNY
jgi:hypothetical protein